MSRFRIAGEQAAARTRGGALADEGALRRNSRLAWTPDGHAIVLWFADAPVVAYDLPRSAMLEASMFPGRGESAEAREKDRQASFKEAVERLAAEHGGPAGP